MCYFITTSDFIQYGFSKESLKLLHSYLSNGWHRTKINKQFSLWQELIQGVPQGSALGRLLFIIDLNDFFYIAKSTNVCNLQTIQPFMHVIKMFILLLTD